VWLPDGQQLVSASCDRTIKFWNSLDGSQIGKPCIGHADSIFSLAVSSDGSFIATASDDKTVRLWSTETYRQIGQSLEHPARVPFVVICPNMELLVSANGEKVLLWSIERILLSAEIGLRLPGGKFVQEVRVISGIILAIVLIHALQVG
jgi:WD40 repeat protein